MHGDVVIDKMTLHNYVYSNELLPVLIAEGVVDASSLNDEAYSFFSFLYQLIIF